MNATSKNEQKSLNTLKRDKNGYGALPGFEDFALPDEELAAAAGDGALVPAKATWKMLDQLIDDGYTRTYLAAKLGSKSKVPALQLKRDFVTVRSAYLVERLFEKLKCECAKPTMKLLAKLRDEGYTQHQIEQRLAEMAARLGEETPSFQPNKKGRISTKAAELVEQLYQELTS